MFLVFTTNFCLNPCQAYDIKLFLPQKKPAIFFAHEYYPCIMYRTQVNGDETIFTVESMHTAGPYSSVTKIETLDCKLTFDCKKGEKVFYKLKKDCHAKLRYAMMRRSC